MMKPEPAALCSNGRSPPSGTSGIWSKNLRNISANGDPSGSSDSLKSRSIAAAIFFVVLWFLGDVILPFVVGGALAYFLDPVADRLEGWGLGRLLATIVISVLGVLIFVVLALAVIASPYRMARVRAFLDGDAAAAASWQSEQSLTAIGSGGLFGRGYGAGLQKLFFLLAKWPFLNRFYKTLATLPFNTFYTFIFYVCYTVFLI